MTLNNIFNSFCSCCVFIFCYLESSCIAFVWMFFYFDGDKQWVITKISLWPSYAPVAKDTQNVLIIVHLWHANYYCAVDPHTRRDREHANLCRVATSFDLTNRWQRKQSFARHFYMIRLTNNFEMLFSTHLWIEYKWKTRSRDDLFLNMEYFFLSDFQFAVKWCKISTNIERFRLHFLF